MVHAGLPRGKVTGRQLACAAKLLTMKLQIVKPHGLKVFPLAGTVLQRARWSVVFGTCPNIPSNQSRGLAADSSSRSLCGDVAWMMYILLRSGKNLSSMMSHAWSHENS